ncbi:restriction endonuclease subunit S [Nocardiopsis akebiae]|uniref:Restriction endonuclease subunit S n=1 Tax=Nocardiopsis akebiae TaxID=2831968 RepID=A0ABX8C6C2_9ACTN|nr:restriction endonuclease subunit S [Nocardiopsis akebiae]QUX29440.1 restriction endonuclease subunit S [Nocardiopsis akebiae]
MKYRKIGEVTNKVSTWNPKTLSQEIKFTYIDLGSVDQKNKEIGRTEEIQSSQAPSRARQVVRDGDVLISTVRPNLNGVAIVPADLDGATASTGFCVLRPGEEVDSSYLLHWVQTSSFVNDMCLKATGQSYPAVSDKIIKSSLIPLPNITIQRNISSLLNEVSTLRSRMRRSIELLDELTQSIFLDMFGDPVANTRSWPRKKLGDLVESIDSGKSPKCHSTPAGEGEWGVLKLGAVTSCEYLPGENKALPSTEDFNPAHEVRPGDLLFTRKNTPELVAACALVNDTPPQLLMPDLIFRINLKSGSPLTKNYLHRLLIHPTKRRKVQELAGGSAASMVNISKSRLLGLSIEIPPSHLQEEFDSRIRAIQELKLEQTAHLSHLDELFASVQQRAFDGTLWDDRDITV